MATIRSPKSGRKTMSTPTNPAAPHFLTLPAEVRNLIYEHLFRTYEKIEIHPRDEEATSGFSGPTPLTQPPIFFFSKADCISLFVSCRQVYHESTSLLLHSNTWIIPRVYPAWYQRPRSQMTDLADWIEKLGSSATMLRKVVINWQWTYPRFDDPWSGYDTKEMSDFVQMGALVKALWANKNAKFEIEFVIPEDTKYGSSAALNTMAISNILCTLRQDSHDLEKYGSQIHNICVARDGSEGFVQFNHDYKNPLAIENSYTSAFSIFDNGRTLALIPATKPELMTLPEHLRERILYPIGLTSPAYQPNSEGCGDDIYPQVCFDLDLKTTEGASPILTLLNSSLRSQYHRAFWFHNQHSIKMRSEISPTDFDHFEKLRRFLCIAPITSRPWAMGGRFSSSGTSTDNPLEFLLQFQLQDATTLGDLRVNMLDFLRVTSACGHYPSSITFRIANGDGTTQSQASMELDRFREFATIALTEFDRVFPGNLYKPCPNIWVNGYGRIVQVELDGNSFNPWEFMRDWWFLDRPNHGPNERMKLCQLYGTSTGDDDIDFSDWWWYEAYRPSEDTCYDGTLSCYLGYLQHVCLHDHPAYWADSYFALPEP
ncbi:hypothetical protein Ptr902_07148 [Pyrenophora tritici-repentis]|nr:hypothetical protein Ptr902_07148 [Pyrenophora tritici-repentis]